MKREFTLKAISLLTGAMLSSSALAQPQAIGTSAADLDLSNYRHFVIYPHLEKALRAQKQNDEQTALKEFRHIHQQAPESVPLTLYLVEALRHFGHDDQAKQLLKEQLAKHPRDARLLAQLAAIPRKTTPVTNVEQLLAQQKACDAAPTVECRSETGQNALRLKQLSVARAQLDDALLSQTGEGLALENGVLQRAIYDKNWSMADEIFERKSDRKTLNATEKKQWFDVLLAGKMDARLQSLQARGLFLGPDDQLAWASSLATRGDSAALGRYLAGHQPKFDSAEQEQGWLYLISRTRSPEQTLKQYQPQFAANQRYVAGTAFPAALKAKDYATARAILDGLPADQMLAERYTLSTATHNHTESLKLSRQMYQRSPRSLALLDQLSWQLMQNDQGREATALLLSRYPFAGRSQDVEKLMQRLAGLLTRYPDAATPAQMAKLRAPLATANLRQLQSQLSGADCQATRQLLGDMSASYNAEAWSRLANCYRSDLPGLALYADQQAQQRQPDIYQHRAVAYQAYAVEDYATALRAWKSVPVSQMSDEDVMAAANTAQAAGDNTARNAWIDEAQKRGLDHSESWLWLHAQRYLPAHPELALADLNQAIESEPTVRALTSRAALYRQQKQTPKAIADLRQALLLEPDNAATQAALGYALWSNRQYAPARDALEKALKASPDDPQLIRQLMYVNERLGNVPQTQLYARQVVDELNAEAEVAPLTPKQNQERFDVRRLHEDIGRRWTFNFDSSIGLRSGARSASSSQIGGAAPGQSYRSYGQLEAEYRIGRNMLVNGDMLSVYSRLFADTGDSGVVMPVKNPMLGTGLRWKPLYDYTVFFAVEEQFALDHHHGETDTMLRASASFLNNGRFSDEWHPNGRGWFAQNLYLDAAQYIRQDNQAWTADYRASWHQKVARNQTIEPYAHVQANGYRDKETQANQLGGIGVRWNIWTGQSQYNAWPHKVSLGLEYQRTFKTINQEGGDRNNAFFTVGVHW
ncbi:phage receptor [Enterobacteriaceae bacterium C23F]